MNNTTPTPRTTPADFIAWYNSTDKITAENYPYGYTQRTTAFYSLEFRTGYGFRQVFQTINPKTGKLNAPKRGTYYPGALLYMNTEGHVKLKALDFYGVEGLNRDCYFIGGHFDLFTAEQITHFYAQAFARLKAETKAMHIYCGADFKDMRPLIDDAIAAAVEGMNTGANVFDKIRVDVAKWEACKVPGFNPFTTTEVIRIV
jgi:beta-galactosidase GanA